MVVVSVRWTARIVLRPSIINLVVWAAVLWHLDWLAPLARRH
jgi:hypothetical protein